MSPKKVYIIYIIFMILNHYHFVDEPRTAKPTQKDLDWISKRTGAKWRSLLTNLGVDYDIIEGYLQRNVGNTVNTCFEGLIFWLKGNTEEPVSYQTLLESLTKSDLSSCATDLEEKLKSLSRLYKVLLYFVIEWLAPKCE